jgi:hypothetical protein
MGDELSDGAKGALSGNGLDRMGEDETPLLLYGLNKLGLISVVDSKDESGTMSALFLLTVYHMPTVSTTTSVTPHTIPTVALSHPSQFHRVSSASAAGVWASLRAM